jgi:peptidyl-prolyl cis-trans isomerase D
LKTQQAQRKYAEVAEAFTNGVYEQSDSLKPVAEKLKIDVRTATGLQRTPSPTVTGVLANPKFLAAVFSPDSVEKKRNTEAVELGANQLAAARITNYKPARTLPLADVRAEVKERLIASRSAELAKKDGAEKLEAWKANAAGATLGASEIASREPGQKVQGAVLDAVLRADASTLPAWVGVDLANQGYAVVRINKVLPRNPPPENVAKQERSQYTQWLAAAENQAYYQLLKERFKVQIKVAKPEGIKPENASASR